MRLSQLLADSEVRVNQEPKLVSLLAQVCHVVEHTTDLGAIRLQQKVSEHLEHFRNVDEVIQLSGDSQNLVAQKETVVEKTL